MILGLRTKSFLKGFRLTRRTVRCPYPNPRLEDVAAQFNYRLALARARHLHRKRPAPPETPLVRLLALLTADDIAPNFQWFEKKPSLQK